MFRAMSAGILLMTLFGTLSAQPLEPPRAARRATVLERHGMRRVDEYYWLRERDNPEVIAYLEAENAYFEQEMAPTRALQQRLFDEIVSRIPPTRRTAEVPDRGYLYYSRIDRDQQYPVYCRRRDEPGSAEEVLLDVNQLAEGEPYCQVARVTVSSSSNRLAYAVDFVGRRKYAIYVKDLQTGQVGDDVIRDVTPNLEWAEDNATLFYTRQDPGTLRAFQVYRHTVGDDPERDSLVYQEDDEEFDCAVLKSRSRKYLFIASEQTLSSEWRYLEAAKPDGPCTVFQPRESNHEYDIDHLGETFFIRTNWNARNFRLMRTSEDRTAKESWQETDPMRPDALLERFAPFDRFLVVQHRREGLAHLTIKPGGGGVEGEIAFAEPVYVAQLDPTPETGTDWLRYEFASLNTPPSVREYHVASGETRIVQQDEVSGGFESPNYVTQRLWATARDGTRVPMSLVRHRATPLDGSAPCLLYGYGSYGYSLEADFSLANLNLLDRGLVYAIAHVRGGQEMGRAWYEDGKLMNKMNTFTDFIDCGRYLVEEKLVDRQRLYAEGGSAGGLLIGAVITLAPELFHGAIADVPFVDVVTTMLDDSIPLTTSEYDEWGNPHQREAFEYMLAYSPYDNVRAIAYPNLLVTTGLHDSQVQYWEPAKWVARMRRINTGDHLLLLKTNMQAGHGGASGRFDRYREAVYRQAFLLMLAGSLDPSSPAER